jgi:hypothetical protein
LIVIAGPLLVHKLVRPIPEEPLTCSIPEWAAFPHKSSEDPLHIAIHQTNDLPKSDACDRPGCVGTNPWQLL